MKLKLYILSTVACFLLLLTLSFGQSQAVITIASPAVTVYTNTVVAARDAIIVQPNTDIRSTAGNESRLYIDKTIQLPASYNPAGVNYSNTIPPIDYNLPVGTIAGNGNVTPSGQAAYTIPIAVPPGTKGMAPTLSLSYNSGSAEGIAGRGWNINGMSAIMRVPKTVYHNAAKEGVKLDDAVDVYALDGNRIIGNRLENDNFSKIIFPNSIDPFFKVETKDGLTMEYGNAAVSGNSQLVLNKPGGGTIVYAWHLSKVYDKHNNYMLYDYYNQNGEVAIKEVKYTGNAAASITPYNSVNFYYDIRADKTEKYLLGNRMQRELLLREIEVVCEGKFMKRYQLAYGYNDFYVQTFLNSITEQGSDFSKLNTTHIKYGEGTAPSASASGIDAVINPPAITTLPPVAEYRSGDFNGDGKSDLLAFKYNDIDQDNGGKTYTQWELYINQGLTGTNFAKTEFQRTDVGSMTNMFPYSYSDYMSNLGASPYGLQTADFNGDGKEDMLLGANVGGVITYTPYYSDFNGTHLDIMTLKSFQVNESHAFVLADINGDGKYEGVSNNGSTINVFWIDDEAQSFSFSVSGCGACGPSSFSGLGAIDFDGDGTQELVSTRAGIMAVLNINAVPQSNNASVAEIYIDGGIPAAYSERFFGDFNGDGISDNVKIFGIPSNGDLHNDNSARIRFGTGNGYANLNGSPANTVSAMDIISDGYPYFSERKYIVADINNDGKSDLVSLEFSTNSPSLMNVLAMLGGTTVNQGLISVIGCAPPTWDYSNLDPGNSSIASTTDPNRLCNGWPYLACFPKYPNINNAHLIPEFLTGDFNGDGKQDIFFKTCAFSGSYSIIYFDKGVQSGQPTQFSTQQFATVISDGFRNNTKFKYETLANSPGNAYVKGNNPQYPVIDFQQPLYIVTQSSVLDGAGGENITNYKYEKAHLHLEGKGFLGFDKMISDNLTAKLKAESEFTLNNTFYEKAPSKTTVRTTTSVSPAPNTLVSEDVYTNSFHVTVNTVNADAHFVTTDNIVSSDHISGAKTTQQFVYDGNGNVTSNTTIIGNIVNAATIETTLVATPNYIQAGSWLPNMPVAVTTTVTRSEDISNPYIRAIQYDYNTSTGDITQIILDPGKVKRVQTDYTLYDPNTGVLKQMQVSDPGAATPTVKTTNYVYDSRSRFVTQTTNPLGQNSFATYDPRWGKPFTETGIDGLVTKYKYDGYGREIEVTTPDNLTAITFYNWAFPSSPAQIIQNNYTATGFAADVFNRSLFLILSQRPGSPNSVTFYDIYGRPIASETDGFAQANQKIFSASKYDTRGNIFKQCGAYENVPGALKPVVTTNLYDDLNRMISGQSASVNISLPATTFAYTFPSPKNGNTIVTTAIPASASTGTKTFIKTTDASGLVRTSEDAGGAATKLTYAYYSNRQLKSTTVGAAEVSNTIEYDEYGRQSKLSEANSGNTLYEYDAFGRLTKQTDAKNNVSDLQYDVLDRITQKTLTPPLPGAPDIYNYSYVTSGSGLNLLQNVAVNRQPANETVSYTYTYDNLNRIKKVDENINGPLFSTLFEYDAFSNLAKETYPGGLPAGQAGFALFHDYDINGYHFQIRRVDNNQIIYQNLSMNALGQYNNFVRGIGLATTRLFDDFGFPIAITAPGIQDLHYTFDPQNSNLIDRADNIHLLTETFTYDNLDRLKTFSFGGLTVNYLDNGNIQNKSDAGSSYVYDPVKIHALAKINNPTINISQSIQNISYSSFQKAQTITEDAYQLDFTYGPDDERKKTVLQNNSILQSTRYFSGDYEETTDAITPANSSKVHYINCTEGLAAIFIIDNANPNGKMYFPFVDHLGSILTVTDEQGNITAEQSFDAWGRNRNPSDWIYSNIPTIPAWLYRGYTGHEHLPQFALINMNGRMYDPVVGRMLSPDNNLQAPDNSQNHNRYSYVFNNPLKYTDPSGNIVSSDWFDREFNTRSQSDMEQFRYHGGSGGNVNASGTFTSDATMVVEAHNLWKQLKHNKPQDVLTYYVDKNGATIPTMPIEIIGYRSDAMFEYIQNRVSERLYYQYLSRQGPQGGAIKSSGLLGLGPLELLLPLPKGGGLFGTSVRTTETALVTKYPANAAMAGTAEKTFLMPGQVIDRYGSLKGNWFSTPSTSYGARSIPPGSLPYTQFTVLKPFEVQKSLTSPGLFSGQTGFGIQFQSPISAKILLKRGIIGIK